MKTFINLILSKLKKFIRMASPEGELEVYGKKKALTPGPSPTSL